MFDDYLERWSLVPDGQPVITHSSRLLPVLWRAKPAMLKIALAEEEKCGGEVLQWWDGEGAARVYARENDALLLELATGGRSLSSMAVSGEDDGASRIICHVVSALHQPRGALMPILAPLRNWFAELEPAAVTHGGVFAECSAVARALLNEPQEITALHGDIHHANILDFGDRGWLAIDPKGVLGDPAFDIANLFYNPVESEFRTSEARAVSMATILAERLRCDIGKVLDYAFAFPALSASWHLEDGNNEEASRSLAVGRAVGAARRQVRS